MLSAGFFQVAAQSVNDSLFQPGDVGLGDPQLIRYLLLRVFPSGPQSKAQHHDFSLSGGELFHRLVEHGVFRLLFDIPVDHVGIAAQ